jgi:hypothetical protein
MKISMNKSIMYPFGLYPMDISHKPNHLKFIVLILLFPHFIFSFSFDYCFLSVMMIILMYNCRIQMLFSNFLIICDAFFFHLKSLVHNIYIHQYIHLFWLCKTITVLKLTSIIATTVNAIVSCNDRIFLLFFYTFCYYFFMSFSRKKKRRKKKGF